MISREGMIIAILLYRLGGKVTITDDELDKFELKDTKIKSYYDYKNMVSILELKDSESTESPSDSGSRIGGSYE